MKSFKLADPLMSFRRNPFEIQANRLYPKKFLQNTTRPLIIILLLLSGFGTVLAQNHKNDSLTVGSPAPTFFLKNLDGAEFYLSNYCGKLREPWKNKNQSVVILSFFATWCAPCLKEIAVLEDIAVKFAGQDLKIFLINVNEKPELVTPFVKEHQIKFPILMDTYGLVASKYGATQLPCYVLIKPDGKIVLLGKGYSAGFKEKVSHALSLLLGKIGTNEVRLAQ